MSGKINDTQYAAVRMSTDDGHHWIDYKTISASQDVCAWRVKEENEIMEQWAIHNPVVRITEIMVKEK